MSRFSLGHNPRGRDERTPRRGGLEMGRNGHNTREKAAVIQLLHPLPIESVEETDAPMTNRICRVQDVESTFPAASRGDRPATLTGLP